MNIEEDNAAEDNLDGRPSKSARKREAASLQELGVELAALPNEEIAALELPETLTGALRELRRLTSHGAQLRQRQYIGKLMRTIDPAPIVTKLEARKMRHTQEIRRFQLIERWRDRLLSEPAVALAEFLQEYPQADRTALTQIVDRAVRARTDQRPPAAERELFAFLRKLLG